MIPVWKLASRSRVWNAASYLTRVPHLPFTCHIEGDY
jgi:hypothetical protein